MRILEVFYIVPAQLLLEIATFGAASAARRWLPAFDQIAFAPAVIGGVNGQAEHLKSGVDGEFHLVVDPRVVAPHVELKNLWRVGCCADLITARAGNRAAEIDRLIGRRDFRCGHRATGFNQLQ